MHTGIKQTNYQPSACTHTFTLSFSRSGIWIKEAQQVASQVETRGKRLNKAGINYPPPAPFLFLRYVASSLSLRLEAMVRLNDENQGNFAVYFPCKRSKSCYFIGDEINRGINRQKLIGRLFYLSFSNRGLRQLQRSFMFCSVEMENC